MLKVEGVGEGATMVEMEVRVMVRVAGTTVSVEIVEVMKFVKICVRLTDCVAVIVGVVVAVLMRRTVVVRVTVDVGSVAVATAVLVDGVAMSRHSQAEEMPARPEVRSRRRRQRG